MNTLQEQRFLTERWNCGFTGIMKRYKVYQNKHKIKWVPFVKWWDSYEENQFSKWVLKTYSEIIKQDKLKEIFK